MKVDPPKGRATPTSATGTETPAAAPEKKPETPKPKEEPQSPRVAAAFGELARKEHALRIRQRELDEAAAKLEEGRAGATAAKAAFDSAVAKIRGGDVKGGLYALGKAVGHDLSYEALTAAALKGGADPRLEEALAKLEAFETREKERAKAEATKADEVKAAAAAAEEARAIDAYLDGAEGLVKSTDGERFEILRSRKDARRLLKEFAEQELRIGGTVLTAEELSDKVEAYLVEEIRSLPAFKKLSGKTTPAPTQDVPKSPPADRAKRAETERRAPTTLSAQHSGSASETPQATRPRTPMQWRARGAALLKELRDAKR